MCGENAHEAFEEVKLEGSSPLVWGKLGAVIAGIVAVRIIPTCVGKTFKCIVKRSASEDHPHLCGENAVIASPKSAAAGSSPLVWGKLCDFIINTSFQRIIPTCVGKTIACNASESTHEDHPHLCGENL